MARHRRASCLLVGLVALVALACGSARDPGADAAPADGAVPAESGFNIPRDFLPPPGQCRIWEPGEPADEQKARYPVGRCSQLREAIPEGAWLVYRPTDDSTYVRVWLYGSEQEVLQQRIYDIETGELVRHIAPASGN
ncbi:MAG: hypothetical protein ACOC9N_02925 [Gemmatimonadota bacterium]